MPTNKKESIIFGTIMCFGMVAVMATYNLLMVGNVEDLAVSIVLGEVLVGFIIALLLDLFIVGPLAKKVTLALPFDKSKKIYFVLFMSLFMIIGMVFFMSMFGLAMSYIRGGVNDQSIISEYLHIYVKNFVVAFPLQLIVMGPLVRLIFTKWIQKNQVPVNG
ncbi:DUF2798 domain-containing protein [Gracilibacillus caseinilyticus]|uniref:DUF2798 domain-containing protein n=1 Tax=Gracilibacillus caseinilyticus TaxID=2932256 RepID=A0ABY4EXW3_9BACI|nr:DUF2798 domain-containing protein [Gracilibacillus caseinilyticus]UOQ49255.1 DUF2798 domain-containing protein [Gracilibacillus caseinilyticus]